MKTSFTVPLAIIFGGIIVAIAVYASTPRSPSTDSGKGNISLLRPVNTSDHILGNPAAAVMIIEYSDFECAYCKTFHETLHQIVANAGPSGNVAWVFRQFPLSEIHQNSLSHARASECVAQIAGNNSFWKFSDLMFTNQPVTTTRYGEFARSAGVQDGAAFATCYATPSETIESRILSDRQNALDIGAKGTPYAVIVTGGNSPVIIDGAYSYDMVKQLVDEALAKL